MELIYTYIHQIDNKELRLEFPFSDEYDISYSYTNREVTMKKKESRVINNFFGTNISKINIVVGKNASRKTTLLNLLGFNLHDMNRYFNVASDSWFSIYRIADDNYLLEGANIDLIKSFNIPNWRKNYYVAEATYNIESKEFTYSNYYNESGLKKLKVIYLPTSKTIGKINNYIDDYHREYIKHFYAGRLRVTEKVDFLNNDYRLWDNSFIKKNEALDFLIAIKKHNDDLRANKNEKTPKLYNSKKTIRRLINPLFSIKDKHDDEAESIFKSLNNQEIYILYYLESQIIEVWNSHMHDFDRNDPYEKFVGSGRVLWDDKFVDEVNRLATRDYLSTNNLDYEELSQYLVGVYELICNKREKIIFGDDNNVAYTTSVLDFVKQLRKIELQYFITHDTISIPLTGEEVPGNVKELLELMDRYAFSGENPINSLINTYNTDVPGISDGQMELIDMMSRIRTELKSNEGDHEEVLLLIDEPGVFMHPEWQRQMIDQLVMYLNDNYEHLKFSIIIATHSPFLLSDVPDSLVLKIVNKEGSLKVEQGEGGYGNNIFELLHNSFFLDAPIGAFSEKKINDLITKIRENTYESYNTIKKEIDLIEDRNVRHFLLEELKANDISRNDDLVGRLNDLNKEVEEIKRRLSEDKNFDN